MSRRGGEREGYVLQAFSPLHQTCLRYKQLMHTGQARHDSMSVDVPASGRTVPLLWRAALQSTLSKAVSCSGSVDGVGSPASSLLWR